MSHQDFLTTIRSKKNNGKSQSQKGVLAIERRKHPRFSIEFPLDYSIVDGKTTYNGGLTVDASEGGLLVYLPERIEIGILLKIEIFYVKGLSLETITTTVKVVWSDLASRENWRERRYGLQFQSIDEVNLHKFKTLLEEVAKTHI
jgi:c-di-GMP-binding flagellar brake protein YcgR